MKTKCAAVALATLAGLVQAQSAGAVAPDPEQQDKACSHGYYAGPRPGRTRFAKDEYLWVVTPEFAKAWCMPPEFVDATLKGAEAIAYRPVQEGVEHCGFGGSKDACNRRTAHGFEIYYKSGLKLAGAPDTKYSCRAFYMLPSSRHLLEPSASVVPESAQQVREAEQSGLQRRPKVWGLLGVRGTRPVWPVTTLRDIQYVEEALPGYSYLYIEGSMGMFSNPRYEKLGLSQFVLRQGKPGDARDDEEKDLRTDYAHIIYLPAPFLDQVRAIDRQAFAQRQNFLRKAPSQPSSRLPR